MVKTRPASLSLDHHHLLYVVIFSLILVGMLLAQLRLLFQWLAQHPGIAP